MENNANTTLQRGLTSMDFERTRLFVERLKKMSDEMLDIYYRPENEEARNSLAPDASSGICVLAANELWDNFAYIEQLNELPSLLEDFQKQCQKAVL